MSTTTIRIEGELKARVAAAAERAGETAHAFILDAIARTVEQVEWDDEFNRVADERWAKVLATGKTVAWDDAKAYFRSSIAREATTQARRAQGRTLTGHVARIELAPEVFDDFDRFFDHMTPFEVEDAQERIGEIVQTVQILAHSPLVGRPVKGGKRELVIGQDPRGYVALSRFVASIDTVFLLAIRSQRESGYKRKR